MAKKLLAALIALSMLGVYACEEDDNDDSCTPPATAGQTGCKVDGNKLYLCMNKKWKLSSNTQLTTASCVSGVINTGTTPNTNSEVGTTCKKDEYQQKCINDNKNALICWEDGGVQKVVQWDCTSCTTDPENALKVKCEKKQAEKPSDVPATCVKSGENKSPALCASDGNVWFCGDEGYYLTQNGKCSEQSGKSCFVCDNGYGGCAATKEELCNGGNTNKPSDVPATCVKNQSPGVCASDNNAWFCGDDGYYLANSGKCTATKTCVVCPDGWAGCSDNHTAFCQDHQAQQPCEYGTTDSSCNGNVATYCGNNNKLKTTTCSDSTKPCVRCADGFVGCGVNCADGGHDQACTPVATPHTSGGNLNECCDMKNYMPACSGGKVTYCSSQGKVTEKTCDKTCTVDQSTKQFTCENNSN